MNHSEQALINRQQHPHDRGGDRERIARARQTAEALFSSNRPVAKPAVTESTPSTVRKPRVLQIITEPAKSDEAVTAPVTPEVQQGPRIPRSHFARIRSLVKYGMTVRQVAEHYGAEIDEIRRIIRKT